MIKPLRQTRLDDQIIALKVEAGQGRLGKYYATSPVPPGFSSQPDHLMVGSQIAEMKASRQG